MLKVHNIDGHLFHLDVELLITHDESQMIEEMTHNCRKSTGVLLHSSVTIDDTCCHHGFFLALEVTSNMPIH
jgi:hypothetical protein